MQFLEEHATTQYILHKHHLLPGSKGESIIQVVNDIIALHATSVGTTYLSLFARMKNFKRSDLDEEFYKKRNLLRLRAMRGTLFITSIELAPIIYQAVKPNVLKATAKILAPESGMPQQEFDELKEKLYNILKNGGKTLHEIKRALPKSMLRTLELKEGKSVYRMTNLNMALNLLVRQGIVISEKGAKTLGITKANRYMLFKEGYPKLDLEAVEIEEAKAMLVRLYIKTFGPVTEEDIAWWTGFNKTDLKKVLVAIEKELLRVSIENFEREHLMLHTDYKQFIKFKPPRTCSAQLLPYEDPYTKGYKIRDRLIDKKYEKYVYVGGGVQPTILLDGKIVGTWNRSLEEGKGPIKLRFFQHPESEIEREVVQKAKTLGKLMANQEVNVEIE
ncbi:MAG: winged helix DNA-binding domain-containing protein [Candidatus Bathyarchaeota archaeon]|jgi:hypothetical protein|nr:winged helix DNA-binding domain-containing protein [Candidatus Bathyarchaeota archaeon A05DMB-5]MDH7558355.1 winged helix DNA-binding domain-containing protein [Candidatus Bathyarchaeota archaeon]